MSNVQISNQNIAREQNEAKYDCQSGWAITKFSDVQKQYIMRLLPTTAITNCEHKQSFFLRRLEYECNYLHANTHIEDKKNRIKKTPSKDIKSFQNELGSVDRNHV